MFRRSRRDAPRTVVVTGASAGVGRATAVQFAERGDRVALLARGEAGLAGAARQVRAAGGTAMSVPVDVADAEAVEAAARAVEARHGPIDVWVNVAFSSAFSRFMEITPEEFRRATEVTYLGYVNGTRSALARMGPRGHGTIVQVGSALAYRGIPLQSAYCGAKHAIQGFNEALRCELMHDGSNVRVTMVQLPAVNTPQFRWLLSRMPHEAQPVPPIFQPEVAARAIIHAADHPRRREYWVGGSTVMTMILNAAVPGVLDRYLAATGFSSQQTPRSRPPEAPANLWHPVDGAGSHDFGAHGAFDDRAHGHSLQSWLSRHRGAVVGAVTVAGTALGARHWTTSR